MFARDLATTETFITHVNDLALGDSPFWIYVWGQLAGSAGGSGRVLRVVEGKNPYALAICDSLAGSWAKALGCIFATCLAGGKILRSLRLPH